MTPPLGALRKPVGTTQTHESKDETDKKNPAAGYHDLKIVRSERDRYEAVHGQEPKKGQPVLHRIGLSDSHSYGYKNLVRDNEKSRQDLARPERMAALAASIARGGAKKFIRSAPRATSRTI